MAPPHVSAFQKFAVRIPSRLEASIAFGLFMESEGLWAATAGSPSDAKYRNYQDALLTDHEIARYAREARNFLNNFGSDAVAAKRAEFLQESLERYEGAAQEGHSGFRWWGILEAALGALAWTVMLILGALVLRYGPGIDPVEIYHKVFGH
jgi:hypothetical protein